MSVGRIFLRFWWTMLFLVFCYGFYLHGMEGKRKSFAELEKKADQLHKQLALAHAERQELLLQLQSQADPSWTELLMMKHLGMVPEGQIKVYFEE